MGKGSLRVIMNMRWINIIRKRSRHKIQTHVQEVGVTFLILTEVIRQQELLEDSVF